MKKFEQLTKNGYYNFADSRFSVKTRNGDFVAIAPAKKPTALFFLKNNAPRDIKLSKFSGDLLCEQILRAADLIAVCAAMAKKDIRYYINGLGVCKNATVATDGYRLHFFGTEKTPVLGIIPADVIRFFLANTVKKDLVTIRLFGNYAELRSHDLVVTTSLINGRFPDYVLIIRSTHNDQKIKIKNNLTPEFLKISKQLHKHNAIELTGNGAQTGAYSCTIFDGTMPVNIGVNAKYLYDAINFLGVNNDLSVIDAKQAVMISNDVKLALVMPCRL